MIHSCGIFLITKTWKVLIGKSGRAGAHQQYSIPKGQREPGEDSLRAALRELQEESNITLTDEQIRNIIELPEESYPKKRKKLHGFFLPYLNEDDFTDIKCNTFTASGKPELEDLQWRSMKECETLLHPTQASSILKITEYLLTHRKKS